ncbi:MAG: hypothetical protein IM516_05575 [Pseudanabaena sp. M158S2SP1A06QC]|jgi:hypothetical protein|uniref:hypothetical protein n=1 Tax=Pseudanabaena mucicola TaxID=71190 RepID=UPI0025750A64|nr:hypothetical protein [Pseudanabaena mucicola]MCA6572232.1 hypothetical protein [Pseudanabaena sp. M53BS1SP1A06MG]MCA6580967.1 hypothetical protein [Pseudanabaena sp. M34BS1SP1A06MG]MCA6585993.1 hypothetical protein [Pseudanabaena sp. M051S1SP1A06QC]MCA6590500.1 hypothetical protein [Pseudanabaena sp. M109S1SP1A06QC]MCA6592149.1 hypothetical protein [Pseudanabaena sp. M38BS1SP1A06MG]MCA6602084.1 hypothetical protein [Pseudanabaena sp. M57BS1SP1A06MG]MCA6604496.1 hypothetical protein [Pseud
MPYSNFTIKKVQKDFGVEILERIDLFSSISPHEIGEHLKQTLLDNVSLAIAVNTEKARSELIIAPVLIEIRKIFNKEISFFSGIELNIDKERDLTGFCDFIISQSPEQLFLNTPVITVVEAKNENIMSGLGQCAAEMIASRIFNEQEGTNLARIYGVVTSGNIWKFLKLEGNALYIDLDDYSIKEISKIIGILCSMIEQKA